MPRSRPTLNEASSDPADEIGFLMSQVAAHASARFASRLEPLGFKPVHVGILLVIRQADGLSQQGLGEKLGMFASRLVGLIDELEGRGLVERRNSPTDRRSYALFLSPAGRATLEQLDQISREHQGEIFASLSLDERAQMAGLLRRIVAEQGLTPGVHPGLKSVATPASASRSRETR